MTPPVTNLIALDIGEVCVHLRPTACARRLGFADMPSLLASHPDLWALIVELETGRLDEDEYLQQVASLLPQPTTPEQVRQAWFELLGPEIDGVASLVAELVAGGWHPVFLSDISPFHHRCVLDILSFAHLVPAAVVSYQVGAMKPAAQMFAAFEQQHCGGGLPALYFDDKPVNIAAARARGWNAHLFTGIAAARAACQPLLCR